MDAALTKVIAYQAPDLDPILAYKGVWALCTTDKTGRVLKATHFVSCMIGGRHPVWACWTVMGKFLRFFGGRAEIEESYPKLVWRRKMATWSLHDITDKSVAQRRYELAQVYKKPMPEVEE